MKTRFDFLRDMYFPGYMVLLTQDYDRRKAVFSFKPTEPQVCRAVDYLTPRGVHIFISQGGICLIEQLLERERIGMTLDQYRELTMGGRLKIIELNQRYRKELSLAEPLQGSLSLARVRLGRLPMVKIDFDIGNHAITGDLTGVLAPKPTPQTNSDILTRNQ